MIKEFHNKEVASVFKSYPSSIRKKLLFLRKLIFDTASKMPEVGELDEQLKWGEPSYLTTRSKSGSTIRLGWNKSEKNTYAIYFNCKTDLVDSFREIHGDVFKYGGNRKIIFALEDKVPLRQLSHCISMALTYHRRKRK